MLTTEERADAQRLRTAFNVWRRDPKRAKGQPRTQKLIATKWFKHSTDGTVWQYLSGYRPLNEDAVITFAEVFGVPIASISPSLARAINSKVAAAKIGSRSARNGSLSEPGIVHSSQPSNKAIIRGVAKMAALASWVWTEMLPAEGSVPWNRSGCYALRVMGDAMHPRYKSGEYLILREDAPIDADSDVLVVLKDGTAMIRELASIRDGQLALRGPGNERTTVDQQTVQFLHRIVGRADASEVMQT